MKHLSFSLCLIILVFCLTNPVSSKDQYVEPLLFGMKVSIQYDMANMFNRFPFQAGLSLILGLGLAGILFFGVITAPFGYMFGVPSEKYVMGDFSFHPASSRMFDSFETSSPSSVLLDYVRSEKMSPRTIFSDNRGESEDQQCCQTFLHYFDATIGYLDFWEPGFLQKWKPYLNVLRNRLGGKVGKDIVNTVESTLSTKYTPEFVHSMFYLIPESEESVRNPACEKRMVCHAHGTLQYISPTIVKIYQKFRYLLKSYLGHSPLITYYFNST